MAPIVPSMTEGLPYYLLFSLSRDRILPLQCSSLSICCSISRNPTSHSPDALVLLNTGTSPRNPSPRSHPCTTHGLVSPPESLVQTTSHTSTCSIRQSMKGSVSAAGKEVRVGVHIPALSLTVGHPGASPSFLCALPPPPLEGTVSDVSLGERLSTTHEVT